MSGQSVLIEENQSQRSLLVLSVGEQGFLEGKCKDIEGWFPSNHVQDIRIFSESAACSLQQSQSIEIRCLLNVPSTDLSHRTSFEQNIRLENGETKTDETIVISRDALSALMINSDSNAPRTVVLQRGKKGFGFVLRGCRGE